MSSFETNIEVDVEVEYEVSGKYIPARLTADPYYSTPAEGPEIDSVSVFIVKCDENGRETGRIEITDFVDTDQFDDEIFEDAGEQE